MILSGCAVACRHTGVCDCRRKPFRIHQAECTIRKGSGGCALHFAQACAVGLQGIPCPALPYVLSARVPGYTVPRDSLRRLRHHKRELVPFRIRNGARAGRAPPLRGARSSGAIFHRFHHQTHMARFALCHALHRFLRAGKASFHPSCQANNPPKRHNTAPVR